MADARCSSTRWAVELGVGDDSRDMAQVEDYYFSAAAGRARIVLGNRRHGESGFMASGRRQARPAAQVPRMLLHSPASPPTTPAALFSCCCEPQQSGQNP